MLYSLLKSVSKSNDFMKTAFRLLHQKARSSEIREGIASSIVFVQKILLMMKYSLISMFFLSLPFLFLHSYFVIINHLSKGHLDEASHKVYLY